MHILSVTWLSVEITIKRFDPHSGCLPQNSGKLLEWRRWRKRLHGDGSPS